MSECLETDVLLELALGAVPADGVAGHLAACASCAAELAEWRMRREQVEAGLRGLLAAAEPPTGFAARVLATVEAQAARTAVMPVPVGALAGLAVVVLAVFWLTWSVPDPPPVRVTLSAWRAPTDSLLRSSAQQLLAAPRLGDFYFSLDSLRELAKEEEGGKDES